MPFIQLSLDGTEWPGHPGSLHRTTAQLMCKYQVGTDRGHSPCTGEMQASKGQHGQRTMLLHMGRVSGLPYAGSLSAPLLNPHF